MKSWSLTNIVINLSTMSVHYLVKWGISFHYHFVFQKYYNNYVRLPGRPMAIYPHMPILRLHRCDVLPDAGMAIALADTSDFGLLGEQSSPKCVIPCLGRQWTTKHYLTPLALSWGEKSVTVQTNTYKQTNCKRYIHTLPFGMCG